MYAADVPCGSCVLSGTVPGVREGASTVVRPCVCVRRHCEGTSTHLASAPGTPPCAEKPASMHRFHALLCEVDDVRGNKACFFYKTVKTTERAGRACSETRGEARRRPEPRGRAAAAAHRAARADTDTDSTRPYPYRPRRGDPACLGTRRKERRSKHDTVRNTT